VPKEIDGVGELYARLTICTSYEKHNYVFVVLALFCVLGFKYSNGLVQHWEK
jgi:hypothetical protein